jgi:hypothetical protein
MAAEDPSAECFVCHKHQERGPLMPGGQVGGYDLVVVSHLAPGSSGRPVSISDTFSSSPGGSTRPGRSH